MKIVNNTPKSHVNWRAETLFQNASHVILLKHFTKPIPNNDPIWQELLVVPSGEWLSDGFWSVQASELADNAPWIAGAAFAKFETGLRCVHSWVESEQDHSHVMSIMISHIEKASNLTVYDQHAQVPA